MHVRVSTPPYGIARIIMLLLLLLPSLLLSFSRRKRRVSVIAGTQKYTPVHRRLLYSNTLKWDFRSRGKTTSKRTVRKHRSVSYPPPTPNPPPTPFLSGPRSSIIIPQKCDYHARPRGDYDFASSRGGRAETLLYGSAESFYFLFREIIRTDPLNGVHRTRHGRSKYDCYHR